MKKKSEGKNNRHYVSEAKRKKDGPRKCNSCLIKKMPYPKSKKKSKNRIINRNQTEEKKLLGKKLTSK